MVGWEGVSKREPGARSPVLGGLRAEVLGPAFSTRLAARTAGSRNGLVLGLKGLREMRRRWERRYWAALGRW